MNFKVIFLIFATIYGLTIKLAMASVPAGDFSVEIPIECARAAAVVVRDAEERFRDGELSLRFNNIVCRKNGSFLEIYFGKIDKQTRGGGLYYKVNLNDWRIIEFRPTR